MNSCKMLGYVTRYLGKISVRGVDECQLCSELNLDFSSFGDIIHSYLGLLIKQARSGNMNVKEIPIETAILQERGKQGFNVAVSPLVIRNAKPCHYQRNNHIYM